MPTLERSSSRSPRRTPNDDGDMDVDKNTSPPHKSSSNVKSDMKVVIVTNLTRNVVESHLQTIFGFYGKIAKVDLPLFGKSGQNRGKAALEFVDADSAQQAASHMDGGQLDGAVLKVELSDLPIRARSRSPRRGVPPPPTTKNGRDRDRFERGRSYSRSRSLSPSRTRSRSPMPIRVYRRSREGDTYGGRDTFRGRPYGRRGGGPGRDVYRPARVSRSRSRSRSMPRRPTDRLGPRRRSPSYSRGGFGRVRGRSRSRSYSVRSSRSRSPSYSRSRSRTRSMSYSSYSRSSRSRSRSRSASRGRRSYSRDDIRDSRSRSPRDL